MAKKKVEYQDIKERVAELVALRDRTGKKPLCTKKRIRLLNEIYDGLLYLWKQSVITGNAKGTGSISFQLERARLEMTDLVRTAKLTGEALDEESFDTIGWGDLVDSENVASADA